MTYSKTAPPRANPALRGTLLAAGTLALALQTQAAFADGGHSGHGEHAGMSSAPGSATTPGSAILGDLTITSAWTRQTPPRAAAGGAYLNVTNAGATEQRLVGGSVDFAARVEIHEMSVTDGVMRMAEIEGGIVIPPGGTVALEPGGLHVMFLQIAETPRQGETVPVRLVFEPAGAVTVEMPVAAVGAPSPHGDETGGGMGHGSMDHGAMDHGVMDHGVMGHGAGTK